jgi:hypothetical protein
MSATLCTRVICNFLVKTAVKHVCQLHSLYAQLSFCRVVTNNFVTTWGVFFYRVETQDITAFYLLINTIIKFFFG